ncbi:MAG: hypothetical protein ABEJ57_01700 [Halobacteriaceae archaeon]
MSAGSEDTGWRTNLEETVVSGVGSFVLGYVALYVLRGDQIMRNFWRGFRATGATRSQLQELGVQVPEQWKVVGMVYHSVHNADYRFTLVTESGEVSRTLGRPFLSGKWLPWLIPMAALVVGGYALARRLDIRSPEAAAKAGAGIVAGYAPAAILTVWVFSWTETTTRLGQTSTMTLGPDLVSTAVFVGVLYPVVFGGLGGHLWASTTTASGVEPS